MTINHLGIILDGNRRFAKRLMLKPWKGHEWGAEKVKTFLSWCRDEGIKEVTMFAFSLENFQRPKKEIDYLMDLFEKEFTDILNDPDLYKNKIKVNFIGRIEAFPQKVQDIMNKVKEATKNHDQFIVNFAMAYAGRVEIVDAVKKMIKEVQQGKLDPQEINPEKFKDYLYMKDEPDMIIRTSGEHRTSGFLLYQGDYSEWFFIDKYWPEIEKEDVMNCIKQFKARNRRFGK